MVNFLAELLNRMIFPKGCSDTIAPSSFRKQILRRWIASELYSRDHPGEAVPSTVGSLGYLESEAFGRICDAKAIGLQVGAMLYALYWLPSKVDAKYATAGNAACLVGKPLVPDHIPFQPILTNLKIFDPVIHYWAAFFVTVYPVNASLKKWTEPAPPEKEKGEHPNGGIGVLSNNDWRGNPAEDSLYSFIEHVDMPTFLGYAEMFLEFRKSYIPPEGSKNQQLLPRDDFIWLSIEQAECGVRRDLPIPDFWPPHTSFVAFQRKWDAAMERQRKKSSRAYVSKFGKNSGL